MFQTVLSIIGRLTGAAPEAHALVSDLVHAVLPAFHPTEQAQLKSALAQARQKSDEAQADFVKAARGG